MSNLSVRPNYWPGLIAYLKVEKKIGIVPGFISISPGNIIFFSLFILIGLTTLFFILMISFRLAYIREKNYQLRQSDLWEPVILSYLSEELPISGAIKELNLKSRDRYYFAEFISDYITNLAGDEYDKLIALFKELKFTDWEIKRLKKRNLWERVAALNQLGIIKDAKAAPYLRANLNDPLPLISFAAAQSLASMRDPDSYEDIAKLLLKTSPWNRIRAAEVFLEYGRSSVTKLTKFLYDPDIESIRKALVIDVFSEFKEDAVAGELLGLARASTDPNIKTSIIKYLGQISYLDSEDFLLESLNDPNWITRSQAAKSLGLIGDPEVIDRIVPLLSDDIWWVRYNAASALGDIGVEGWEKLKEIKATNPDKFAREICSHVLSELDYD